MGIKNLNTINRLLRLIRNNPVWIQKEYIISSTKFCITGLDKRSYKYYYIGNSFNRNKPKKIPMYLKKTRIYNQNYIELL